MSENETDELPNDFSIETVDEVWTPETPQFFGPTSRSILITGEIEETMTNNIIGQLLVLDTDEVGPITVYINTQGGDVIQALAIYDVLRMLRNKIITVAMGACMSAGLLILQGGDTRAAFPSTRFMYHEPLGGADVFNSEGAASFMQNYEWAKAQMKSILTSRADITEAVWARDFEHKTSFFLTSKEALSFGLIDDIVEPAGKIDGE